MSKFTSQELKGKKYQELLALAKGLEGFDDLTSKKSADLIAFLTGEPAVEKQRETHKVATRRAHVN